jgi:hypothetical protein
MKPNIQACLDNIRSDRQLLWVSNVMHKIILACMKQMQEIFMDFIHTNVQGNFQYIYFYLLMCIVSYISTVYLTYKKLLDFLFWWQYMKGVPSVDQIHTSLQTYRKSISSTFMELMSTM